MAPGGRARDAGLLVAFLALGGLAVLASAQDSRPKGKDSPPTDAPGTAPLDPFGFPETKPAKKTTTGTPMGAPADKNDAKTATSRSAYIARLLAAESRDRRPALRIAAQRACIEKALAAVPPTASAEVKKALDEAKRLLAAGKWAEAQAQAAQASALDWKLLAARLLAARALDAQERCDDELKVALDVAVSSSPADPVALHARALVLWHIGRIDDARKDLLHAREASPADGSLALSIGVLELDRGDAKAARDPLFVATDAMPSDVNALREMGRTLWLLEDWTGAAAAFERVVHVVEGPPLPPGQVAVAGRGTAPTERLALAVLFADRLDQRATAKEHARKFLQDGGVDFSLDAWVKALAGG